MKTMSMRWKAVLAGVAMMSGMVLPAGLDPVIDAEDRLDPAASALVDGLNAKSAKTRARVATAYGRIQKPACVEPLLILLGDKAPAVRTAAIFALGQLAWKPEFADGRESETAAAIARHLNDKNIGIRVAAIEAIGKIGLDQTPTMVGPLLQDKSARVRAETLLSLFRYRFALRQRDPDSSTPDLPQAIVDMLPTLATDKDKLVRRSLIYGFARFKDTRGLSMAVELSMDKDEWTRFFAMLALTKIADASAAAAIEARLCDTSAIVRRAAVQATAAIGKTETLGVVVDDEAVHVRSAVATALGASIDTDGSQALEWLRELAGDASGEVRASAINALAKRFKDAVADDLSKAMGDACDQARAAAVEASASLSADKRKSIVDKALADSSVVVRCAALSLLATDASAEAFQVIQDNLGSAQVDVRAFAITALASRKEAQALDLGWKAYQDNMDARFIFLREAAVNVMAAFDNAVSNGYLREILKDAAYPVAVAAYKALVSRGVTDVDVPADALTFSPYRGLKTGKSPVVTLETTRGVIKIKCYPEQAPIHVANFIGLVRQGFFDGKTWQRVVPNFVIQGGSPSPLGGESQTYMLRAEINTIRFGRGAVGMSRYDLFDTGDSQLFITHVVDPHLDGMYTLFGQIVKGFDALDQIEAGDLIIKATVASGR